MKVTTRHHESGAVDIVVEVGRAEDDGRGQYRVRSRGGNEDVVSVDLDQAPPAYVTLGRDVWILLQEIVGPAATLAPATGSSQGRGRGRPDPMREAREEVATAAAHFAAEVVGTRPGPDVNLDLEKKVKVSALLLRAAEAVQAVTFGPEGGHYTERSDEHTTQHDGDRRHRPATGFADNERKPS